MSRSFRAGALNSSVSLAVTTVVDEIELPKLSNGSFAKSYLFQAVPGGGAISFGMRDSGVAFVFGDGPLLPTSGTPLPLDSPVGVDGTNRFVRAITVLGTGTIVITPVEG